MGRNLRAKRQSQTRRRRDQGGQEGNALASNGLAQPVNQSANNPAGAYDPSIAEQIDRAAHPDQEATDQAQYSVLFHKSSLALASSIRAC